MIANNKHFIALRYWLLGANYHLALKALHFTANLHLGTRKDGVTPEFDHQLHICLFLKTLSPNLSFPEETLTAALLHDTPEDKDVGFEEITAKFGTTVSQAVMLLTKKYRGTKIPLEVYYQNMAENAIASVVKGADRINNLQSMNGVFTVEKQKSYLEETRTLVLPCLKQARKTFTTQDNAYQNLKFVLNSQIALIEAMHQAGGTQ